jgi:hypothetical protein
MDILNWLYLKTAGLIKTKAVDPNTDLVALGANVGFNRRDDQYQTYAMPLKDAVQAGNIGNTGYYTIDLNSVLVPVVDVTTSRGVIEIIMATPEVDPQPAFATAVPLSINNAEMDFTNPDNVYMQFSVYYSPAISDSFIPYVIATGFAPTGADYAIFNANPTLTGAITSFTPGTGTTILAEAGQTYSNVGVSVGNATFTVTRDGAGVINSVVLVNSGTGYVNGDTFVIDGANIGGASGVDDLSITVDNTTYANQFGGRFYLYYELYNF